MKSSVENVNSVQLRLNIELPADTVRETFDKIFQKIQKNAKVQGFRPGKAPLNIVRRLYKDNVAAEVNESLIKEFLFNAIEEHKIRPVSLPVIERLDDPNPEKPFLFTALIDIMPEIKITQHKNIPITCETFEVSDESISHELASLQKMHAKTKELDVGAVATKEMVAVISHTASTDGHPLDDMKADNLSVELGKNQLFADLENAIIGMKSGEEKDATITLTKDFPDKGLAGKTLTFHLTLHSLKELVLPELDDEFAKDVRAESLDDLKTKIRENLLAYAEKLRRNRLESLLLDRISELHPFDVPPSMVDEVIDDIIREEASRWPEHVDVKKMMADDDYRKSILPVAKKRARNTLILAEVAKQENIIATEEEITKLFESNYRLTKEQEKKLGLKKIDTLARNLKSRIKESLILSKAVNFLVENAIITDKPTKI